MAEQHKIQIKVLDVATGEERGSQEFIVEGRLSRYCCCTNCGPVEETRT